VTFPAVISSSHDGKPMSEQGSFALAMKRSGGAGHIVSWAWATA
jgi:hypothetical protein